MGDRGRLPDGGRGPATASPRSPRRRAAVYLLRTFLEHFISGVRRTYAYELLDESAEPALRKSEQHFGLLRHDFSPKPAYTALRNLLALMGPDQGRAARPRPVRLGLPGRASGVRHLVLQRADGTVLVALWRLDSVWDRTARRDVRVKARVVAVAAPGAASVRVSRPVAGTASGVPLRGGRVRVGVAGDPLVLEVSPRAR